MDVKKLLQDISRLLDVNSSKLLGYDNKLESVYLKAKDGKEILGFLSAAQYIGHLALTPRFVGDSVEEEADIYQWLEYCLLNLGKKDNKEAILAELNNYMTDKVFFVSNMLTLADMALFLCLHEMFKNLTFQEKELYNNLSRWYKQVQHETNTKVVCSEIAFCKTSLYT